eukprot:6172157-Pleurochrysis_carterae.AAC.3
MMSFELLRSEVALVLTSVSLQHPFESALRAGPADASISVVCNSTLEKTPWHESLQKARARYGHLESACPKLSRNTKMI